MPYIKKEDREIYEEMLEEAKSQGIANAGDLNYLITMLCKQYAAECGECYRTYNEVIGVLECAKQEYYRRRVAPYEDTKIKSNGDV